MTLPRVGVLASHDGTNLQAIIDACEAGLLASRVAVVISNNSGSGALERARRHSISALHLSSSMHSEPADLDRAISDALRAHDVDIVLLAGYMKRLGPTTLAAFDRSILNTHPALLPRFGGEGMYGSRVHEAVLGAGEKTTGASIHLVEAEYDTGPIVAQCKVPVIPGDTAETLATRVQNGERALVVDTLRRLERGELRLSYSKSIHISDYNDGWPELFDAERARLAAVLPEATIEHVGSTSVRGLAAKPIIDIMLGADRLATVEERVPAILGLGYEYMHSYERYIPERRYFRGWADDVRTHLHCVELNSEFWERHLVFRDYLRGRPDKAAEYAALKRQLGERHSNDGFIYTEGKTNFIEACVRDARAAVGGLDGSDASH